MSASPTAAGTPPTTATPRIGATRVPLAPLGVALAASTVAAVWAFLPLGHAAIEIPVIDDPKPLTAAEVASLDLGAFRTPIWVAAPAPPVAAAPLTPPPPPPPLKLQLLAIVREGDGYKAALYDPDTDRLLIVAAGDRIGTHTVESVGAAAIALRDERGMRTLSLREGSSP